MPKKKENKALDTVEALGSEAKKVIESLAKGLGVAATELWIIFVRQYIVRGCSELFTALLLYATAWFTKDHIGYYAFIPFAIGTAFVYGAIAYLGNPRYYALNDIVKKIKEFKDSKTNETKKDYIRL